MDNLHPAQGTYKASNKQTEIRDYIQYTEGRKLNNNAHVVMMVPLTRPP